MGKIYIIGVVLITLKEALSLSSHEIVKLREELKDSIKNKKELGAYVEQLIDSDITTLGRGIPIAIKDNIQVKGWDVTCASKILQGYKAPYSATVIDKLLSAGLSPFGRCNMDEFTIGVKTVFPNLVNSIKLNPPTKITTTAITLTTIFFINYCLLIVASLSFILKTW